MLVFTTSLLGGQKFAPPSAGKKCKGFPNSGLAGFSGFQLILPHIVQPLNQDDDERKKYVQPE
jgi:hypothetical protein